MELEDENKLRALLGVYGIVKIDGFIQRDPYKTYTSLMNFEDEDTLCILLGIYGFKKVNDFIQRESYKTYINLKTIYEGNICCIYGIYSTSDDSCIYVGSTSNFNSRINSHYRHYDYNPSRNLYKIIREAGGWDNFRFRIIEYIDDLSDIYSRENYHMSLLKPKGNCISAPKNYSIISLRMSPAPSLHDSWKFLMQNTPSKYFQEDK
jgi:hypothetical protein